MMRAIPALLAVLLFPLSAWAVNCSSLPFTLTNGTTADATQVMANLNSILNCANTVLAPIASPTFVGTPAAPTASPGTNTTQIATTAFVQASSVSAANPTATAGPTAVNGSASTYMRSDAAPPVQKGTNAVFGLVEGDGSTISLSSGVATVANITVNSTTCTPGSSCTVPAAAGTLTGSALAAGVTTSSLTSFGSNPLISSPTIDATSNLTITNLGASGENSTLCYNTSTHIVAEGNGCGSSDARLKHDWKYDVPGLDFVMAMRPGTFDWRDRREPGRQVGLTAQAVKPWLPELVSTGDARVIETARGTETIDKVMSLDYARLTVPLIAAVQQQQGEIVALKSRIAALEKRHTH